MLTSSFRALGYPAYRRFSLAQLAGLVAYWARVTALPWLTLDLGGTPIDVGLVVALQYLPSLMLWPFSGMYADRAKRHAGIVMANLALAATSGVLLSQLTSGGIAVVFVLVIATLFGVLDAFDTTFRLALLAGLVDAKHLASAVGVNIAAVNMARVLAPLVMGVLTAVFGIGSVIAVTSACYCTSAVGFWLLGRTDPAPSPPPGVSLLAGLGEARAYLRQHPAVFWSLGLLLGSAVFGMNFQALLPQLAQNVLGWDARQYGAMFAALGIGALLGSLVVVLLPPGSEGRLMLAGVCGLGMADLLLGLNFVPDAAYVFVGIAGVASAVLNAAPFILLQATVHGSLRGRMTSLYVATTLGSAPIGAAFTGGIATISGPAVTLVWGGALTILVGSLAYLKVRRYMETSMR